jgi:iron complex transport system substrate-binding protein
VNAWFATLCRAEYILGFVKRIVSLLPAATEIAGALGLMEQVVGVSHECDFPEEANDRPRVTHCPIHNASLTSREVDEWVRRALREKGTLYTMDELLIRNLQPDVILAQKSCDVCAVGYGTVATLAQTLPGPPRVVNLEPTILPDIFDDIRRVAETFDVPERAEKLIVKLSERVHNVRERAAKIANRPSCFLMEWVDPPSCFGHWGPELVEIAGGHDSLGRKRRPSAEIDWHDVLDSQPEIIVLALCGYDIDRARRDYKVLMQFPDFQSIPAVRSGQVYLVDASAYFSRPGPRIVDSLENSRRDLHPAEFPEFTSRGSHDVRVVRAG